jgi:serine/threonine-protein kinase HipA
MTSSELAVFIYLPGSIEAVPAGLLTLSELGPTVQGSEFGYGTRYLDRPNALEVDPVSLDLRNRAAARGVLLYPKSGLTEFGAIRDAAPDAWGRRVLEAQHQVPANSLPESEYLLGAGSNRVGALDVRKDLSTMPSQGGLSSIQNLDYLLEAARRIESGLKVPARLDMIFGSGAALGGARPKVTVVDQDERLWLAKLPSTTDTWDVPQVEEATLRLARDAGLDVPETRLVALGKNEHVLLIERFDRTGRGKAATRRHFISALTLVGCTEMDSPQKSYVDIADGLRLHGDAARLEADLEELFVRMVFNILVTNDDDHLRNHGLLRDVNGWTLSPLYDVVPRPTYATERFLHLGIGAQGRLATLPNAMSWSSRFGLTHDRAYAAIDRVWRVAREWKERFESYGVPPTLTQKVESAFRHASDVGGGQLGL